jgi:IS605 OrfB family transposase
VIKVIHGEIWSNDFTELNQLINNFQSCVRFAYCRFSKDKLELNDVRKTAKTKYSMLNARQRQDAVLQGETCYKIFLARQETLNETKEEIENKLKKVKPLTKKKTQLEKRLKCIKTQLENPKLIFGGKKAWNDLKSGNITKEEWLSKRNNQIYSRGDKASKGNLNIRIVEDTLRITIGTRKWITYKLFIPKKFQESLQTLLESGKAYNVRLKRKDNDHFKVMIDYKVDDPIPNKTWFKNGVIGVDTNPDRIAIANVSPDGNLISTKTLINNRILYAKTEKRDYDISCLVKEVITQAIDNKKGIVFEGSQFKKEKEGNKKWKRIQSNYVWKKLITQLERKCIEYSVPYKKVNPAYTSIIGKYKYRWMHKITIHESAAYVIGRRGMGFNEKLSFYKADAKKVKELVFGTLEEKYKNQKVHSWSLWKHLNDNIEAILTGLQVRLTDLKEFVGNIWYRGAILRSEVFLQELFVGSEI